MKDDCLPAPGIIVPPTAFAIPRAAELAGVAADLPYVTLVECRRDVGEVVVLDLEVEIGQRMPVDIRRTERVAIVFPADEDSLPEAFALRADFPPVPHLNLRRTEFPRSLCLYQGHPSELLLGWTPRKYIERIREWLAQTAKGDLHAADQPLEPLLLSPMGTLVLPPDVFTEDVTGTPLSVYGIEGVNGRPILIAERDKKERPVAPEGKLKCVAIALMGDPQEHGIIRSQPETIAELHGFLATANIDLVARLRERLRAWREDGAATASHLIIIVGLPKTRHGGGAAEAMDFWAFLTAKPVRDVGRDLGLWEVSGQYLTPNIGGDDSMRGESTRIDPLNPQLAFTRERAAAMNGFGGPVAKRVVGVGMGALGSQAFTNLLRGGFGEWTIVDNDQLLPHNLARHQLSGWAVGHPKVLTLAHAANGTVEGDQAAAPVVADVLKSEGCEPLKTAFSAADLIFDFSASVPVARHLARGVDSPGRRFSLFLNPAGTDLVLLAEDASRAVKLDCLEMQYYRFLANDSRMDGHLAGAANVRYGTSCRDVSSTIPQHLVALHAAIGTKALRDATDSPEAAIVVWRADPDAMCVERHDVTPVPMIEQTNAGWTLCTDSAVADKVMALRKLKLPNETGGILIGSFDMRRKIAYVVDAEASPRNSREAPTLYIRGSEGMADRLSRIESATAGNLEYVGEWHSHPHGHDCTPSDLDAKQFAWLVDLMAPDGRPGVMLIAGDPGTSWYLGRMN